MFIIIYKAIYFSCKCIHICYIAIFIGGGEAFSAHEYNYIVGFKSIGRDPLVVAAGVFVGSLNLLA